MSIAQRELLTFEEFLQFQPGEADWHEYELIDGVITPMEEPSGSHENIRSNLSFELQFHIRQHGLNYVVHPKPLVKLTRREGRRPDLIVINSDRWNAATQIEAALFEPPDIVVEVVSSNWQEDYQRKPLWYAALGVPEYWIVDSLDVTRRYPTRRNPEIEVPTISILTLKDGEYSTRRFTNGDRIVSQVLPELELIVNKIL